MIKRFADNRSATASKRERIAKAQFEAQARATAATISPVFADVKRFAEPSPTRMVWMPRTDGLHPELV